MILDENITSRKLMATDLNDEENILRASSVNTAFVARKALNKCEQFNLQNIELSLKMLVNPLYILVKNLVNDSH